MFSEITISNSQAQEMLNSGWNFNWSIPNSSSSKFVACKVDDEIQGLVEFTRKPDWLSNEIFLLELAPHNIGSTKRYPNIAGKLLAYVAKDSFENNFEGFVVLESKTVLIAHYVNEYGAKLIDGKRVFFDTTASKNPIERYLSDEK